MARMLFSFLVSEREAEVLPDRLFYDSYYSVPKQSKHKYPRIYGFHKKVCKKSIKGVLVWGGPRLVTARGVQTLRMALLKGKVIAMSTSLGRWMCALRTERSGPNRPIRLLLTIRSVI